MSSSFDVFFYGYIDMATLIPLGFVRFDGIIPLGFIKMYVNILFIGCLYFFCKTKIFSYASIGWLQKQISQIQTTFRFEIWSHSHWNIRFCRKTRQYRLKRYRYCCGIGETILVIDVWLERKSEEVIRMWSRFGEIQRFFAPNIEE